MGDFEFKIEGLEPLLKKFESIDYDIKRKGGRAALRKAANVIVKAAQSNAMKIDDPATASAIYRNITMRWNGRLFKKSGSLGFRVGVLGGAKAPDIASGEFKGKGKAKPGGVTFHWRFIEFGTQNIAARPFMRPALADNTLKAEQVFIAEYSKAIDRAIKRARR
jgi:HK97 gp10 family phage protein